MLVDWLIRRAKRTPYYHLDGYMLRWWLVPYRKKLGDGTGPVKLWRRPIAWALQQFGIAVRIHEILRSDEGRHPHNHPWWYVTIILRGSYIEDQFDEGGDCVWSEVRGPGQILFRRANSWHKLTLLHGTVTTLFITGKQSQGWGFNVNGKHVPRRDYNNGQ